MKLKNEMMPLGCYIFVEMYPNNPYDIEESESGLVYNKGTFENPDTGQIDKKDLYTVTANIIEIGPDVKFARPGDDCMVDMRSMQPFLFKGKCYFRVDERNIIVLFGDNLKDRK